MDSSVTYEKLWHLQHGPQNNAALKSSVLWRMTQQRLESLLNRYPELRYRKVLAVPQRRPDRHRRRPRPSVGSSREMVSKVMGGYREKGQIRFSRRLIEVVDRDELLQDHRIG